MGASRFHTTRWSLVLSAATPGPDAARALNELCELYWYPIYAFVRRQGQTPDNAEDLTQGFFASLLARDDLLRVDAGRGRFRNYLLGGVKHFMANEWDRATAQKRGGGATPVSFDAAGAEQRYLLEPTHGWTAERLFERRFAIQILATALARLGEEFARKDRSPVFEKLRPTLEGVPSGFSYRQAAAELDMTEGSVKVTVHRMRRRFGDLLREEVAGTLEDDNATQAEIDWLHQAVRAT